MIDNKQQQHMRPTKNMTNHIVKAEPDIIMDLDVNDNNSRAQYSFYGHNQTQTEHGVGVTFKNYVATDLGGDVCGDEWSKWLIEYIYPSSSEDTEPVFEEDTSVDWSNSMVIRLPYGEERKRVSFYTQFSSSYNCDVLEMNIDYRFADCNTTELVIYHNGSEVAVLETYDNSTYSSYYVPFYSPINYNDIIAIEARGKNGDMWSDKEAWIRNIMFTERIMDTSEIEIRKNEPIDVTAIKTGEFAHEWLELGDKANDVTKRLKLSTAKNMTNPIYIDMTAESQPVDLPADNMYASIVLNRKTSLGRFDYSFHKYVLKNTKAIEPPTETIEVCLTADTARKTSGNIAIKSDTDRYIISGYHHKLDYDYLIENPNAYNMTRATVNHELKTFGFDTYEESIIASHNVSKKAAGLNNMQYLFTLPYDDNKQEQDVNDLTYGREFCSFAQRYVDYVALPLKELHRVYGMLIFDNIDASKSIELTMKVKVATVGDLEQGEADFVQIGTDTSEYLENIFCTNFYREVTVTISRDDIWDDGTARVHVHYNNFHLGNYVDVELRIADIQLKATSANGMNLVFQSAQPVDTTAIKQMGANILWDMKATSKVTKTIGFSTKPLTNVYPSDLIINGIVQANIEPRISPFSNIDYMLKDGVALNSNCPDKAYLTVMINRPASLDETVEFKSVQLAQSNTFLKDVNKTFDTSKSTIKSDKASIDTQRNVEKLVYKDVPVTHSSILQYVKIPTGSYQQETELFKLVNNNSKIKKMTLKVYRREDTVWKPGNTSRVYVKYKLYDVNKKPLTGYLDVPEGTLQSQYVIVDIEVPENTKYVSYDIYMYKPADSKEHRVKLEMQYVNINNSKAAHILTGGSVREAFDGEYCVHSYGPFSTPAEGYVCTDRKDTSLAVGSLSFSDYNNMTNTNKFKYKITTNSYIHVKTPTEDYENLVWIEEDNAKIIVNKKLDTQRDLTSDITPRWISSYMNSTYAKATSKTVNGITSIDEVLYSYHLRPDNLSYAVAKLEVMAYRKLGNTIFTSDFVNGANEYVKLSYSLDNITFKELVTDSTTKKAIIDTSQMNTSYVYFKISGKNLSNTPMEIAVTPVRAEVFHKRLQFMGRFNEELYAKKEEVLITNKRFYRYPVTIDIKDMTTVCDLKVEANEFSDDEIKIGLTDKITGKTHLTDGKSVEFNPYVHSNTIKVYTIAAVVQKPTAIYLTTMQDREVNIVADTLRKASGKTLNFLFDSKRRTANNDSINTDSLRCTSVTKDKISDLKRISHATPNKILDGSRLVIKHSSLLGEIERRIVVHSNTRADSFKTVVRSMKLTSDTSRMVNTNYANIVVDTLRRASISNVAIHDVRRNVVINRVVEAKTLRKVHKTLSKIADSIRHIITKATNTSDSLRTVIKDDSFLTDSNRQTIVGDSINLDTNRRMVRLIRILSDTRRRVRKEIKIVTEIGADTKRLVVKNIAIKSDTRRFMGFPYGIVADSLRKAVISKFHVYDTHRQSNKKANIATDSIRKAVVRDNKTYDTQRNAYWHLYTNASYDLLRKTVLDSNKAFDVNKEVVVNEYVNTDTLREVYFEKVVNIPIDTQRYTAVDLDKVIDTDRLPFYFVDKNFDAKRSHVYQGKTFLFDTARDRYVVDMTRISYDTLRAVKVINPYAKVYEYNIKVCNSLEFNIKM